MQKKGRHAMLTCIMCKLSRCNLIKLEAIQARHHMQHASKYHTATWDGGVGLLGPPYLLGISTALAVVVECLQCLLTGCAR
jgi:hypothetical protein